MTDRTPTTEAGRRPTTANGAFLSAGLQALGFDEDSADEQVADVEDGARAPLVAALRAVLDDTQHVGHDCGDPECPVDAARAALSREERP